MGPKRSPENIAEYHADDKKVSASPLGRGLISGEVLMKGSKRNPETETGIFKMCPKQREENKTK